MTLEKRKEEIRKRAERYIEKWLKDNNIQVRQVEAWTPMHNTALRQFMLDELARLEHGAEERDRRLEALKGKVEVLEQLFTLDDRRSRV